MQKWAGGYWRRRGILGRKPSRVGIRRVRRKVEGAIGVGETRLELNEKMMLKVVDGSGRGVSVGYSFL